ncbi:MAG: type I restriction endonuclease subunit R [Alphaproteobacteria bacterium]|nr:type I restriction endonuclease subunit R [Alphaproteobacteria bacterium]
MTDILHELPDFDEASSSQIPALLQLINLGYDYIPRNEVNNHRESKSQYILHDIAKKALRDINEDIISDKSIDEALYALEKTKLDDGMIKASEDVYSNLLGGVSVPEIIDGKKTSPQLKFIDWQEPQNNVYHVVAEFEIEEDQNRRPDIVLFVNGIPFAVIECKKASVPVDEAVYQMIRNQKFAQTPKFFLFPQILIATNINEIKYGTMQTPFEFYSVWKEKDAPADYETKVLENINKPIDDITVSQVCKDLRRKDYVYHTKESLSAQDLGIYALLSPSRLLDLVRNFIIYDNGIKKITRYQQYFAIKKTLQKIKNFDENGRRRGGLIWHTQGSGKSLTMVMLVKNLIEEVKNPRVIVVTDRTDLDIQIRDTFATCNIKKGVVQATSCKNLLELIKHNPQDVITTLVHKFDKPTDFVDDDNNMFVLIDEAHRTQSGDANMMMNKILPSACQIAFTGTPLMKKVPDRLVGKEMSKSQSIEKFGGLIDEYTISEAEKDGAVLPLIYQGRFVDQKIDEIADKFYERLAGRFSESERKDFAKKCISSSVLEETSQRIEMIALDVNDHFVKNFQNTGLKGQLVAPSKYAAVMFKQALDLLGEIRAEVIISDTLADEGKDDTLSEHKKIVTDYMTKQKHLYGSLESREKQIIRDYKKNPDGCELLIVVDKLLTGFDAPCDTVLYLAKQLKDHNLLQAIARVNRVYDGADGKQSKTAGLIVDYSKNAKNLKSALELFSHYDPQDIDRALLDTDSQINLLNSIYDRLHAAFKDIKDKQNTNDYVEYLKNNEKVREDFYNDVNKFIKQFSVCYSLYDFHNKMDTNKLLEYKKDLKRFVEIKKTTQLSLAEKVDFSKYKDQIMKLLDKYVTAKDVEILSKEINLSDMREFNQYIEDDKNGLSDKSKADAILAQTKKVIKERYEQDEAFYGKFSELIDKILQELKQAKKEDLAALLAQAKECQKSVTEYEDSDIPEKLRKNKIYHPFYRNIRKFFKSDEKDYSQIVEDIVQIIKAHKIVDFQNNTSVKREIFFAIEDYLFDEVDEKLSADTIEQIVNTAWNLAVQNKDML